MFRILQRTQIRTQTLNRIRSRGYSTYNSQAHNFNRALFVSAGVIPVAISYQLLKQGIENETKEDAKVELKKESSVSKESKSVENTPETKEVTEKSEEQKTEGETAVEEEKSHEGAAYNPETGEINWDCPCLGGMAHGPCGEEFKEAFACFVYSETEPKGIDCIKKFENMRSCFKQHPEHYKEELEGDEEPELTPVADIDTPAPAATDVEEVVLEEFVKENITDTKPEVASETVEVIEVVEIEDDNKVTDAKEN